MIMHLTLKDRCGIFSVIDWNVMIDDTYIKNV